MNSRTNVSFLKLSKTLDILSQIWYNESSSIAHTKGEIKVTSHQEQLYAVASNPAVGQVTVHVLTPWYSETEDLVRRGYFVKLSENGLKASYTVKEN